MVLDHAENLVSSDATSDIGSSDSTITVNDASVFPDPATYGNYQVTIDDSEIVRVTATDDVNNELTVLRGRENTSSQQFTAPVSVEMSPTAKMFQDIEDALVGDHNTFVTKSGDGNTRQFTLVHNLDTTAVDIAPIGKPASTDFWIVDGTQTTSQIDIKYAAAPPTGTDNLGYVVSPFGSAGSAVLEDSGTDTDGGDDYQLPAAADNLNLQSDGAIQNAEAATVADSATDPTTNGELRRNGSDVKVYSGGSARNLSNIGSGGGGTAVIETQTPSNASSVEFTGLDATYGRYQILIEYLVPASGTTDLQLTVSNDGGSTYQTDAGDYQQATSELQAGNGSQTILSGGRENVRLARTIDSATGAGVSGHATLISPSDATMQQIIEHKTGHIDNGNNMRTTDGSTVYRTAEAIDAVRLQFGGANIGDGKVTLLGVQPEGN
jgi:hypothetical protein